MLRRSLPLPTRLSYVIICRQYDPTNYLTANYIRHVDVIQLLCFLIFCVILRETYTTRYKFITFDFCLADLFSSVNLGNAVYPKDDIIWDCRIRFFMENVLPPKISIKILNELYIMYLIEITLSIVKKTLN